MTYDKTSKKKILKYAEEHGHRAAIKKFSISSATLYIWIDQMRPDYVKPTRKSFFHKLNPDEVKRYVQQAPDSTLAQIGAHFGASSVAVYNCLKKLGFSFKERSFSTKNVTK
jgi:transposase